MIIRHGNADIFAIESLMAQPVLNDSQCGIGYFVLYVNSMMYGCRELDSTCLGCSYNEVKQRLRNRGKHVLEIPIADPVHFARSAIACMYGSEDDGAGYDFLDKECFLDILAQSGAWWAPDGDEAFDDGSNVFQIDCAESVRIIAFKRGAAGSVDESSLRDLTLDATAFYTILEQWIRDFEMDWRKRKGQLKLT